MISKKKKWPPKTKSSYLAIAGGAWIWLQNFSLFSDFCDENKQLVFVLGVYLNLS